MDIHGLNLEELGGVVSLYPWYAGARKELCRRMAGLGPGAWSEDKFAEAALHMGSARIISRLMHSGESRDCPDADVKSILEGFISPGAADKPRIVLAGQDFFSQADYDSVREKADGIFSSFARGNGEEKTATVSADEFLDFCTETLAELYASQGYVEQAVEIYSKLSLRYPEKSVYFASLIEKIKNL